MKDDRLTKQDWITAGLAALARSGIDAVKADVLAKSLGVSRGSFYWHFADVTAFRVALLAIWEQRATDDIIALVEGGGGTAIDKLHRLARLVFANTGALERQVRAWASQHKPAAAVQDRVDRKRIAYVSALLQAAGRRPTQANARARFLYLALVGHFAAGRRHALETGEMTEMIDLLLSAD